MTLALTLIIQLVLAILGGTAAITALILCKKVRKDSLLIFSWMMYIYYIFWGMNVVRCLLLYDDMLSYQEDGDIFLLDIILAVSISIFVVFTKNQETKRGRNLKIIACIALAVISLSQFISFAGKYGNVNAALYGMIQPERIVVSGLVVLFVYLLFNRVFGIDTDRGNKYGSLTASVSMLFVVTLYLYPTIETLITNADEFAFQLKDIWYLLAFFGMIAFVTIGIVLTLASDKRRIILCVIVWMFSVNAYLQGMFLNGGLFLMDGKKLEWSNRFKAVNLIVWLMFFVGMTALCFKVKQYVQKIVIYSSVLLCVMQMIGVISTIPEYRKDTVECDALYENYLSMDGMYEVASDKNVIVFVLDTYDVDFIEQILEKKPDFLSPLKGFIYYPDNVSQFSRTFPSIPYMLTQQTYFYEEPLIDYIERAFSECSFWDDLKKSDYKYYLFEEDENIIGGNAIKGAANFVPKGNVLEEKLSFMGVLETVMRIGNYRLMPYSFKNRFVYTSDDINDMVVSRRILDIPMYEEEDAFLWEQLRDVGLIVGNDKKAFRFIHTKGAHAPYTMNENGERVSGENCTPEQTYEGCMRFVYDYLSQLQALGVYEQSAVIITADHGENFVTKELTQETNPILFIKPYGADADSPMQISDIRASQNDLLSTIAAIIGVECDDAWGIDLLNSEGEDRIRTRCHYYTVVENGIQTKTRRYNIEGDSRDFDNWIATEEYHDFGIFY